MTENIKKAEQTAKLLVADLTAAHGMSDPLVEIILLPLLEQASKLERELRALNSALRPA